MATSRAQQTAFDQRDVPRWGWQERAACREQPLELFFGPDGERPSDRAARERTAIAVCAGCPVRDACLEHALGLPENYGVWGGTTEVERSAERRRRRDAAA